MIIEVGHIESQGVIASAISITEKSAQDRLGQFCQRQCHEIPEAAIWPEAIPLFWSRQRSPTLLIHSFSSQSSVECLLMIISMILITKIAWPSRSCLHWAEAKPDLVPKPAVPSGLGQGWFSASTKQAVLALAPAQKCIKPLSLAQTANRSGSFNEMEESAKVLLFCSSSLHHLCCLVWVWIYPKHRRFTVGSISCWAKQKLRPGKKIPCQLQSWLPGKDRQTSWCSLSVAQDSPEQRNSFPCTPHWPQPKVWPCRGHMLLCALWSIRNSHHMLP